MKAQHVKRLVVPGTVAGALAAGAATAQDGHLWPRFSVAAGGYLISSTDKIGIDGEIGVAGRDVSFSQDLGLPKDKTLLGLGLEWTPWARHSFDFEYYSFDRSGSRSSSRQIQVGDRVFPVGAEVSASLKTTSIEAGYTYWFMHRERFGC